MLGTNPIRKPLRGSGEQLDVQEIFATIQGEGPNTGMPAIFIRLGGCNLACDFCDTEFESFEQWHINDIIAEVQHLAIDHYTLVVITGGEPFRQPIETLCDELIAAGFAVQIETNGTLYRVLDTQVEIVCSPKNTGQGYMPIRLDLLPHVTALKFIISATHSLYQAVQEVGQHEYNIPVYIQPMDEGDAQKNDANLARCLMLAQQHGYRLSLQTHKLLGLP